MKKTIDQLEKGDVLVPKEKGVIAELVFVYAIPGSGVMFFEGTHYSNLSTFHTEYIIENYTLPEVEEERWVPKQGEEFFGISSCGNSFVRIWNGGIENNYQLSIGNVHRTREESEAWEKKATEALKAIKNN